MTLDKSSYGLGGVFPMIVTPFSANGTVAEEDVRRVVSFVLNHACHGVSALGLGAEVDQLKPHERFRIAEIIVDQAAGAPVIVGCSASQTKMAVRYAQHSADIGAAAIMIAPPARTRWSDERLMDFFGEIATAVYPLGVMIQDAPSFLGIDLGYEFVARLNRTCSNVAYAKSEAVPVADKVAAFVAHGNIGTFGGHGALYYLDVLDAGAVGVIPGSEFPEAYAEIFRLHQAKRTDEARVLFSRILPLVVAQFQSLEYFVASSKLLLCNRGLIQRADVRGETKISDLGKRLLLGHARAAGALPA